jgi:hypothetical protein
LKLSVPTIASIQDRKGNSVSGRLAAVDLQHRRMTVEIDQSSQSVSMSDITRVTFQNEAIPESKQPPVIRGSETWTIEPLSAFRFNDGSTYVEVEQKAIAKQQPRGMTGLAASRYTLREIMFEKDRLDTIKVSVTTD